MPLAPLRDPSLLLPSVAQVVDVKEEPGRELADTLTARLEGKQLMLLLDNASSCCPMRLSPWRGCFTSVG